MTFSQTLYGLGALLLIATVTAAVWGLKTPVRPPPSGPFSVGTQIFTIDKNPELTPQRAAQKMAIRAWFPATNTENPQAVTIDGRVSQALGKLYGFPTGGSDGPLSHSHTNATAHPAGPFPLILFSHGAFSFVDQNFSALEELASHGFIVVSIGHPGESALTIFADNSVLPIDPALNDSIKKLSNITREESQRYLNALNRLTTTQTQAERITAARELGEQYEKMFAPLGVGLRSLIEARQAHFERTFSYLKQANETPSHPFFNKIDFKKVGVMGHSLGAYSAIRFAQTHKTEVHSTLSLDVPYFLLPDDSNTSHSAPLLSLYAEKTQLTGGLVARTAGANSYLTEETPHSSQSIQLEVQGASHMNFTDMNYLPQGLRWLGLLGTINGGEAARIMNHATLGFFTENLKGSSSEWLLQLNKEHDCLRVISPL